MSRLIGFGMLLGGILGLMTLTIDIWTGQITGGGGMAIRPGWEGFAVITMVSFGSMAGLVYAVTLYALGRRDGVRKHELAIFLSTLLAGAVLYVAADFLTVKEGYLPWVLAQPTVYLVGLMMAWLMARPSRRTPEPPGAGQS